MSPHQDTAGQRSRRLGDDTRGRLLASMPVSDRRRDLAGVSTAVLEGGNGPPVVVLHGVGHFAAMWSRVIPKLVTTHRVIVPDLPGLGASQVVDGRLEAAGVLAWLGELIERTCPSPPVLVGHQAGGAIAARFASDQGDRVARLVLVDALGLGPFRPAPWVALAMVGVTVWPTEQTQDRFFGQCLVDLDGVRDQMGQGWQLIATYALHGARAPSVRSAGRRLMKEFGVSAMPEETLARIRVPTTLIWGRHDLATRLPIAEAASARFGWPLRVIDDCGADPHIEQPDALLGALRDALVDR